MKSLFHAISFDDMLSNIYVDGLDKTFVILAGFYKILGLLLL